MALIHLSNANFKSEVLEQKGIVLVDFWAQWCGPCQMLSPIIEEISADPSIKVAKLDVDESSEIASQYNVTSIPTVIIFKDGLPIKTIVGFHQKGDYLAAVQ